MIARSSLSSRLPIMFNATNTVMPKRFRYDRRTRPQNKGRALLMQVAMPRISKSKLEVVHTNKKDDSLYGIDVILAKEVDEIMKSNKMVIACLYTKPALEDQYFHTRYELQQNKMNMTRMPSHVLSKVLMGTKYENLLTLCQSKTALVFSDEPNLKLMFEALKKNKYICPLGGLYYDKFYSLDDLKRYSQLPDIKQLQGELVGIMSSQLSSTYNLLQQPINSLAYTLKQRQENLENEKTDA